jgi:hypothetical protein
MVKITRTYQRPSSDIPFYHEFLGENTLIKKHMYENYILTNKVISQRQTMSEDKLKYMSITTWSSTEDFFDFSTDVTFARLVELDVSKKYEEERGITLRLNIENI